jgi:hypothetical protein
MGDELTDDEVGKLLTGGERERWICLAKGMRCGGLRFTFSDEKRLLRLVADAIRARRVAEERLAEATRERDRFCEPWESCKPDGYEDS